MEYLRPSFEESYFSMKNHALIIFISYYHMSLTKKNSYNYIYRFSHEGHCSLHVP